MLHLKAQVWVVVSMVLALLGGVHARAMPSSPVAALMELSGDAGTTRLHITLSRSVQPRAFLMQQPDRVVIDLPEMNFQVPPKTGQQGKGLVSSFRYGLLAPGRSRIVIDLNEPALVTVQEEKSTGEGDPTILTLTLTKTTRAAFQQEMNRTATELRATTTASLPSKASTHDRRPVIVIDPGHGGIDPGARTARGVTEKTIVFAFAQTLRQRLEQGGRYRVLMTREDDRFVPLWDRVRFAREAKADLFISIHADSISAGPEIRGATVYTNSERASDAASARLAEKENRADLAAGQEWKNQPDQVADILLDLARRETRVFSAEFAGKLVGNLGQSMRLNTNPLRSAGFVVLRAPDVPSVLVELGYLSSKKDIDLLMSEDWRARSATAMAAAVERYFTARNARQMPASLTP